MTKDEAKTIEDAARKWTACACEYELAIVLNQIVLNQDASAHSDVAQQEQAFLALLNSMIDDTKMNQIEMQIATDAVASAAAEYAETAQAFAKVSAEYAYMVTKAATEYACKVSEDATAYADAAQIAADEYAEDARSAARNAVKYADFAAKSAERLPTVYPRKSDWVEFGAALADKTPAELDAENALCNAAYIAKKPE